MRHKYYISNENAKEGRLNFDYNIGGNFSGELWKHWLDFK